MNFWKNNTVLTKENDVYNRIWHLGVQTNSYNSLELICSLFKSNKWV